jgi:hypothetical protein
LQLCEKHFNQLQRLRGMKDWLNDDEEEEEEDEQRTQKEI